MKESVQNKDKTVASIKSPTSLNSGAKVKGTWTLKAFDADGVLVAEQEWSNIVVNSGKNYLLDAGIAAGAAITSWSIGLSDGTPTTAATDTMASHAGWAEVTAYSEGTRQGFTAGAVASESVDNSASPATFSVNADGTTIGGAFLTSDSTKGGTTGTLYSIGAFSGGDVVLNSGSTLQITATFSLV